MTDDPDVGVRALANCRDVSERRGGEYFSLQLAADHGVGNGDSDFEFQIEVRPGAEEIAAAGVRPWVAANQNPNLQNVFTTYSASTPQINVDVDPERAQTLGVSVIDIFDALQTALGGAYFNDFNFRPHLAGEASQADAADRVHVRRHLPGAVCSSPPAGAAEAVADVEP